MFGVFLDLAILALLLWFIKKQGNLDDLKNDIKSLKEVAGHGTGKEEV